MASIYATGSKGHHKFTLTVTETGTSKADNSSTIAFSFVMSPVITGYGFRLWGNDLTYRIVVNGSAYTGNLPDYGGSGTVTVKSGTQTISHDADGTKTLALSFSVTDVSGVSYTPGNASANGTMELTRILRTPPTLTAAVEDSNPNTVALTGDKSTLVRYFSNAAFTLEATAHDGATIASRTAACGGKTLSGGTGVFEKAESGSFVFTATDSYGNSVSKPLELTMIPYVPLTCNLATTRPDAEGDMAVSVSGNCFSGDFGEAENTLAVFVRYREIDGSFGDWVEITASQSGNSYTASGELTGLDYQKAYAFQAKAEDLLDTAQTPEYTAKAIPVFDWGENDFNVNGEFKMNGTPVADFIVEQGVSGIWHYRKWNSGVAECWGVVSNVPTVLSGSLNNFAINLPFLFSSADYVVQITNQRNGHLVTSVGDCNSNGDANHTQNSFVASYYYTGATAYTVRFNVNVIGRWKEENNE